SCALPISLGCRRRGVAAGKILDGLCPPSRKAVCLLPLPFHLRGCRGGAGMREAPERIVCMEGEVHGIWEKNEQASQKEGYPEKVAALGPVGGYRCGGDGGAIPDRGQRGHRHDRYQRFEGCGSLSHDHL